MASQRLKDYISKNPYPLRHSIIGTTFMYSTFAEFADEYDFTAIPLEQSGVFAHIKPGFESVIASRVMRGVRSDGPMKLCVKVIAGNQFEAYAFAAKEADFIVIRQGLINTVHSICRWLVKTDRLFGGDLSSPRPKVKTIGFDLKSLMSGDGILPEVQLDHREDVSANILANIAILFVLEHEFAHIYHGHVDGDVENPIHSIIVEPQKFEKSSYRDFISETLEWDADCSAIEHVLVSVLAPEITNDVPSKWIIPDSGSFGPKELGLHTVILGCAISLCLLAAGGEITSKVYKAASHPHPYLRVIYLATMVRSVLNFRSPGCIDDVQGRIDSVFMELGTAWNDLFGEGPLKDAVALSAVSDEQSRRIELWTEAWSKLHPTLVKAMRAPAIAPARPWEEKAH